MTHELHGTTRTDAVDAASWTVHPLRPSQDGPDAWGGEAVRISVEMSRVTRLVVGASVTVVAVPRCPTPPGTAATGDVPRGFGRVDVRATTGRVAPRGRS